MPHAIPAYALLSFLGVLLPPLSAGTGSEEGDPTSPPGAGESAGGVPRPPVSALGAGAPVRAWQPMSGDFPGPSFSETDDDPNPFLDYRLNVRFTAPSGAEKVVPGFFDGDGQGGGSGNVWRVRFTPDEPGTWGFEASFRTGPNVAVSLSPNAGTPTSFDGLSGTFDVDPADPAAPGFWSKGFLEYVGGHYLRFQNGEYFLKGGTNSPENLLAYWGFDDVSKDGGFGVVHCYAAHAADWEPGDPLFSTDSDQCPSPGQDDARGIIGLLNYLADLRVNSVYFLPMNLGGDAWDTSPFVDQSGTPYGNTHYDISRLRQWNAVFEHAMRKGILLHFVLQETEEPNEAWLDGGVLGVERKLFFRELVARFGHHPAIKWMHGEEWDLLGASELDDLEARAEYMNALDPYDHYNAVHNRVPFDDLAPLVVGNPDFQGTSIQYGTVAGVVQAEGPGAYVERWREESAAAGTPWVVEMDENNPSAAHAGTVDLLRKQVTYPVFLSGGHLEWYYASDTDPSPDVYLDDLVELEPLFEQTGFARAFVEDNLEFWDMHPADGRLTGETQLYEGGQVLADPGRTYAVYLPEATSTGQLDLPAGQYRLDWFDPRAGVGGFGTTVLTGGGSVPLGPAPDTPAEDWVALVRRVEGLLLGDPAPGEPGKINTLEVAGAQPGSFLVLLLGSAPGDFALPLCPSLPAGLAEPLFLDTLVADAAGTTSWSPFFPATLAGPTTLYFQLWDVLGCEVSNTTSFTWP